MIKQKKGLVIADLDGADDAQKLRVAKIILENTNNIAVKELLEQVNRRLEAIEC